jgi:hypothetical protein
VRRRVYWGSMTKRDTYAVNDRVSSPTYGNGTISAIDEKYTTIQFDTHGTRKFLTSLVALERSDSLAPVKPERAKKTKKVTIIEREES